MVVVLYRTVSSNQSAHHLIIEVGKGEVREVTTESLEPSGRSELRPQDDGALELMPVNQAREAAEFEHVASKLGPVDVRRPVFDEFM